MFRIAALLMLTAAAAPGAHASCQDGIAAASARADALQPSSGKAALLEQIQRADVERHEGDEAGCVEALSTATDVLDKIDAARRAAQQSGQPSG